MFNIPLELLPPDLRRLALAAQEGQMWIAGISHLSGKAPAVVVATVATYPHSFRQFYDLVLAGYPIEWVAPEDP